MKNITFFQAANLTDQEVKDQFVARQKELQLLLSEIYNDDMTGSIQHYIIIGQRGSGKSTLLRRIQAEVNTEPKLSERLIAVNLSEEQAGIYRLHDLWERVCDELRNKGIEVGEVDWQHYEGNLSEFSRALYSAIQQALKAAGKKLLLLLDNIDRILENIKGDDNHLFRELLMNHKDVRIIGGSTRLSEHHWKYDQPFYQFFQIIRLKALSEDEMKELLMFWSDFMVDPRLKTFAEKQTGKLNAVRILSDGMPRTMLHLVELLINKPEEHGYEYLKSIVDKATPIYQERLGTLSPLQQKIAMELSFFWDAVKVKELAAVSRMESKTVSAVLKQLVDIQIVEKRNGSDKNMLYLLKERFFNLWLIMTQGGPKQKSRVKWLTIFLETWYEPTELKNAYLRFCSDLNTGKLHPNQAIVMAKAFVHSNSLSVDDRDNLLDSFHKVSEGMEEYKQLLPKKSKEVYDDVQNFIKLEKWDKALFLLDDIDQEDVRKLELQGFCLMAQGDSEQALKKYTQAIELGSGIGANNAAVFYRDKGDLSKAIEFFKSAADLGLDSALYETASVFYDENKMDEAEFYYKEAAEAGDFRAMNDLAILYANQKKFDEAEKLWLKAIESHENNGRECGNLGYLYNLIGKHDLERKWYDEAVKKGNIKAAYSLAVWHYNNHWDSSEAKKCIEQYFHSEKEEKIGLERHLFRVIISIWSGNPEILDESEELIEQVVAEKNVEELSRFIESLLSHYQENGVWLLFKNEKFGRTLKELVDPLYYVTAKLLNTLETSQALLAMPPEYEESVNEMIQFIQDNRKHFYP